MAQRVAVAAPAAFAALRSTAAECVAVLRMVDFGGLARQAGGHATCAAAQAASLLRAAAAAAQPALAAAGHHIHALYIRLDPSGHFVALAGQVYAVHIAPALSAAAAGASTALRKARPALAAAWARTAPAAQGLVAGARKAWAEHGEPRGLLVLAVAAGAAGFLVGLLSWV